MAPLTYKRWIQIFIGLVEYYGDMWACRLHILQPITKLSSTNVKFKLTGIEQKLFDEIKWIVGIETFQSIQTSMNILIYINNKGVSRL